MTYHIFGSIANAVISYGWIIGKIDIPFDEYHSDDIYENIRGEYVENDDLCHESFFIGDYKDGIISNIEIDICDIIREKFDEAILSLSGYAIDYCGGELYSMFVRGYPTVSLIVEYEE